MLKFEWDSSKEKSNRRKHGVSFEEAQSIFYDEFALQFYDDDSSSEEDRFLLLGMSNRSRLLLVVHCERANGEIIRVISIRKATSREGSFYKGKLK